MTIQDLKDNRNQIIEILTSTIGESNLKSAMNMLKDAAEYSEMFKDGKTIEEAIEDITNGDYFQNKKMTIADYISANEELTGKRFDLRTHIENKQTV